MNKINNIKFYKTDDNSVGLYDENINDILHSKSGALSEAVNKFVIPIKDLKFNNNVKVLDICYGIGYNTKAFINLNSNLNILTDAIEINKELIYISPFIKDGITDIDIKLIIINSLLRDRNLSDEFISYIQEENKSNNSFYNIDLVEAFSKTVKILGNINYHSEYNYSFLHNIYYNYISCNNNIDIKPNKYNKCMINFYTDDARASIKDLNNVYDIVFLDAYSPQKDPTLWTIDFLNFVKSKMHNNSILTSYSKSSPFRSALIKLGFYVGKTIIDNKDMGTVASLSYENISHPLSDYDYELLSTTAGIPYRDSKLNMSINNIIKYRNNEISSSNLLSHTAFLKKYKK